MRIVYLDFPINFGGAPQAMVYLARRLAERHEVHVLDAYGACAAYRQAVAEAGLSYSVLAPEAKRTYIGGRGLGRLWSALKQLPAFWRLRAQLIRKIRALDPDVILVWSVKPLTFVALSWRLRRYPSVLYTMGWERRAGAWLRGLMRYRAAAVLAVSTASHAQLRQAGVPESKLHLGSMTIDMAGVQQAAGRGLERALPGAAKRPRLLLMAARPDAAKGHLTAYRAIARLKKAGYDPALWMSGRPAVGHNDSFMHQLNALADELDIRDNVFHLGWIENMPALVQACDVALLPSRNEGFPRSILEAMVLRRPVVATPVGGVPDSIKDGRTGLLIPVDDDAALADRIARLTADAEFRARLVEAACEFAHTAFGPDEYVRRIEGILESVVR
jgi:glycosyltransferase involved in cell wall biosynthesis